MNNKNNIAVVILAAIVLVILLILGIYAQQQLIHTGSLNPGRSTAPSNDTETSAFTDPEETEDTTIATDSQENSGVETQHSTQATDPSATIPGESAPPEPSDASPEVTGASGNREDEFPLDPVG